MHQLTLISPEALIESVGDALTDELGALSVTVEDADADGELEQPLFGEPGMAPAPCGWRRSLLHALFDDDAQATRAATLLLAQPWAQGLHVVALTAVEDTDWVRLTQSQFEPVAITPQFWIVPTWHQPPAQAERSLRLDPGLAFGTGTHPTTRMCLRWIARQAQSTGLPPRVLDYGCGSGILAIAAAMHGATDVTAIDIDPAAVEATRANAQANGVTLQAALPQAQPGKARDSLAAHGLVLANILATPLTLLAPLLATALAPDGHLVLAGILERQAGWLQEAYRPWLALEVTDRDEGWILMTGRRPAA